MKQGNRAIGVAMLVMFIGVVAYFTTYVFRSFTSEVEVASVYTYTAEDVAEVSGYLVRSESVIGGTSTSLMEVVLEEGEKIHVGGTVAKIYSSQEAADRQNEIETVRAQLERLEKLDAGSGLSSDTKALDNAITDLMISLHGDVASGRCGELSQDAVELEDLVFEREYQLVSGTGSNLANDIAALSGQLTELEAAGLDDSQTVTTEISGVFSSQVDGFESALHPDMLTELTPSKLARWRDQQEVVEDDSYIGKLITEQKWYFAATMKEEDAARMGGSVTLRFTNDFTNEITMKVESVSQPEDGVVAVVFSSTKYLTQTTQMRYQAAEIVYDSTTGLRVPLTAVRINEKGEQGVFVITGTQSEWKPVTVLYTGSDYCLVASNNENEANALRTGDTVIAKGKEIEDGKVIEL